MRVRRLLLVSGLGRSPSPLQKRSVGKAFHQCRVALCAHMRCKNDAQRGAETASSRSHPPLAARAGRGGQGTRTGIELCSKQRLSHQWQRSKIGQTETALGRNAGRQEQMHQEGRLHRSGASELALDVARCCSITHRVPALSELRLRAPPRYATRWSTHEGFPVHYTRAGATSLDPSKCWYYQQNKKEPLAHVEQELSLIHISEPTRPY